ncbi:TIGR03364 family FAD-dependent oxidoreductase [Kribbella sp. CA-293567]|uniref:TIGR03364 family FAD-dependent oxidoreductase n=1 Tax=Kribbella sp. CA-293567 TaxID=3002436 RepID=UPI0022DCEF7E|nr:TIGR03364 family FAD-dependent oxidoreductase [Kribbella sp. CA-293567]WBQ04417.1 TIGR03364 family FAD-dependent oxidoreductase [Kribbella sp. CA-293567]
MRVVIVGGGVLGTFHAREAVRRGHQVVQVERELEARGASVRNFGLVWVSGRASGPELATAQRARELWADVPGISFRPAGSLTVCRTDAELAVAREAAEGLEAADRGFRLLNADETRKRNPALRGDLLGSLECTRDAIVEPRELLPALRAELAKSERYEFRPGREIRAIVGRQLRTDHGERLDADLIFVCTGATHSGLIRELAGELPVRRVRLQMMQTAPLDEELTTAVADADSFRYYPAYRGPALDSLGAQQPQCPVAEANAMQLLMVQRQHGGLTIGDTHEYDEPFPFDVTSEPYDYLQQTVEALLGRPLPPIVRRWAGVYSQATTPGEVVVRRTAADGVHVVTGPGGRGMTMSPAIAEESFDQLAQ